MSMPAFTENKFKTTLTGLTISAVTIAILAAAFLIRYDYFLNQLRSYKNHKDTKITEYQDRKFPGLNPRQAINLGFAHGQGHAPASSYIHFPREKTPGKIRIGFFGCSFTVGSETAQGHDFPSLLQRRLREQGRDDIEVINFGVGSHGTHHAHLMWEYLGREYDLDYAVFLIFDFHVSRDSSFIFDGRFYKPLRARYVLKGDGLELIEVLGRNRLEAARIYYQIIPPLQYLRYDRLAPPALRSLVPVGRDLKFNPFYYKSDMTAEDEILETYVRLFRDLSARVRHVVVITVDEFGSRLSEALDHSGIDFLKSEAKKYSKQFLYQAPEGHRSALGNQVFADELFAFLTGEKQARMDYLKISDTHDAKRNRGEPLPDPLSSYASVRLDIQGSPAASFIYGTGNRLNVYYGEFYDFKKNKTQSLLQLTFRFGRFLPLPFLLEDRTPVYISFRAGKQTYKIPFGYVDTDLGVLGRVILAHTNSHNGLTIRDQGWAMKFFENSVLKGVSFQSADAIRDVEILLGKEVIMEGIQKNEKYISFRPLKTISKKSIKLRATEGQYPEMRRLDPPSGSLQLALEREDGTVERYPTYLQYEMSPYEGAPFEKPIGVSL